LERHRKSTLDSATDLVAAAGEIFGGGIAPSIGGAIAQNRGIHDIFWMPLVGVALGAIVSLFMKETAPPGRKDSLPASRSNLA
jgi:fucose permease